MADPDLRKFRKDAISDLEELRKNYLEMVKSPQAENKLKSERLERAVRLLPGLLKVEEALRSSAEEEERGRRLEESLEPLFAVLGRVLGSEFNRRRREIIAALEAELKSNGSQ